jgi:hypothetical protein
MSIVNSIRARRQLKMRQRHPEQPGLRKEQKIQENKGYYPTFKTDLCKNFLYILCNCCVPSIFPTHLLIGVTYSQDRRNTFLHHLWDAHRSHGFIISKSRIPRTYFQWRYTNQISFTKIQAKILSSCKWLKKIRKISELGILRYLCGIFVYFFETWR